MEEASEAEIALAKAEIGAEGIGCEPASAVTLAGLKKMVADDRIHADERVVLLLTGHTLKDPEYTLKYHRGELLTEAEIASASEAECAGMAALQKAPLVLDASTDDVLRVLEKLQAKSV